jgi:uncharacterized protein
LEQTVSISRRQFLTLAGASGLLSGLSTLYGREATAANSPIRGYGTLVKDAQGLFALPPGFKYQIISQSENPGAAPRPSHFDGMSAFAGKNGQTILIRNHELYPSAQTKVLAAKESLYDPLCGGGTTTLVLDRGMNPIAEYVSLAGTSVNCGGGKTLWGSWISCEENVTMPGDADPRGVVSKPHGYNFEVPAGVRGPVKPVPLVAMGRFRHEAIAIDPRTGIVYQTEDDPTGAFYRFIPKEKNNLAAGGVLEALRIIEKPQAVTKTGFTPKQKLAVDWVRIEEPNPTKNTVREEAFKKGAAQFFRGEGIVYGNGSFYFTCTQGGQVLADTPVKPGEENNRGTGQVWRYQPGRNGGTIELFLEPNDRKIVDLPDNITIAPNGHLIVCEDGKGEQRLVGITPKGQTYVLGLNTRDESELAGVCFAPDGRTMFVNIYDPGVTLAITGPWKSF